MDTIMLELDEDSQAEFFAKDLPVTWTRQPHTSEVYFTGPDEALDEIVSRYVDPSDDIGRELFSKRF